MAGLTPDQLAVFVAASCERQGVPVKVTDVRVLGSVATLLRGDGALLTLQRRKRVVADDGAEESGLELRETGS